MELSAKCLWVYCITDCIVLNVQNPLVTMVWVAVLNSTLLPSVNFGIDTYGFCEMYSVAGVVLFATYSVFCLLCCVLSPAWFDVLDIFHFFAFPVSFGWRLDLLGVTAMMLYWNVQTLGVVWQWLRRRHQISPTRNGLLRMLPCL